MSTPTLLGREAIWQHVSFAHLCDYCHEVIPAHFGRYVTLAPTMHFCSAACIDKMDMEARGVCCVCREPARYPEALDTCRECEAFVHPDRCTASYDVDQDAGGNVRTSALCKSCGEKQ